MEAFGKDDDWFHEQSAAICVTAKVASTEIQHYLIWHAHGLHTACAYGPSLVKGAFEQCKLSRARWAVASFNPPLIASRLQMLNFDKRRWINMSASLVSVDSPNATLVVPYRDPWRRLLSGFYSKAVGVCH